MHCSPSRWKVRPTEPVEGRVEGGESLDEVGGGAGVVGGARSDVVQAEDDSVDSEPLPDETARDLATESSRVRERSCSNRGERGSGRRRCRSNWGNISENATGGRGSVRQHPAQSSR